MISYALLISCKSVLLEYLTIFLLHKATSIYLSTPKNCQIILKTTAKVNNYVDKNFLEFTLVCFNFPLSPETHVPMTWCTHGIHFCLNYVKTLLFYSLFLFTGCINFNTAITNLNRPYLKEERGTIVKVKHLTVHVYT